MFVKDLSQSESVEISLDTHVSPLLREERAVTDEVVGVSHVVSAQTCV